MKQWIVTPTSSDCEAAARRWAVAPLVAQLLLNRGLRSGESPRSFLAPSLNELLPPRLLPDVPRASGILADAIRAKRRITIYGDYDVDGTAGVAILWHLLHAAGAAVDFYVPHRLEEGYGLNCDAVRRLIAEGTQLIVSVDCGITACDAAKACRDLGASLIITDHHTPQEQLPIADAIVHPALGSQYPNADLCGAGVAFKLAWGVAQEISGSERVRADFRDLLSDLLPLAALGTIADVVSLTGENRVIARHGLRALPQTRLPGLSALIESAGLAEAKIDGYDVGFKLAPRINAAGRMGHARLAVELLTRATPDRAKEIALYLEEHNRARQSVERKMVSEAVKIIERDNLAGDAKRAIVLASPTWHAGVVGIVAARLVERYHRPVILIALSVDQGQGSGRSVRHFDLARTLEECQEHLVTFGGHAMAAGLRIRPDLVPAFTEAFISIANQRLTGDDLVPKLRLDAQVGLHELTLPTVESLVDLGPFGAGNPKPKLATEWVELAHEPRCVGKNQEHLQASFRQNGSSLKAIGFGQARAIEELKQHRRCRVAFEPLVNEFNGRRTVEMSILDMQFPT